MRDIEILATFFQRLTLPLLIEASSCDLSQKNEVLHFEDQASDRSINEISPNLVFRIKKLSKRNLNKIIIGNCSKTCFFILYGRSAC